MTYFENPALNFSSLKLILKSPAHYQWALKEARKETDALLFGSAFHCAVLEPQAFEERYIAAPDCDKRTKEGKALWADCEASGKAPIRIEMLRKIAAMKESLINSSFSAFLEDIIAEEEIYTQLFDVDVKCKVDFRWESGAAFDLKTTEDASPKAFERSIATYKYHQQAAWYLDCLQAAGHDIKRFIFLVIEKEPPFAIACYELDEEAIAVGRQLNQEAVELYKRCTLTQDWEGYSNSIVKLSLPRWAAAGD